MCPRGSALPLLVASGTGTHTPCHDAEVTQSAQAHLLCPGDIRHARGDAGETRPFCSASDSPSRGEISGDRGGEGSGAESGASQATAAQMRVRLSLAFLPAAADTFLPTRPGGPCSPQRGRPASMASRLMSDPFVSLSVSQCGRLRPAPGCHYLVSGRLSSLLWAQHTKPSRAGCGELLVRSAPPPPTRPRDHAPPTLPFPHSCLRSQLPAHQLVTRHSLLVTSQQGTAAGL